MVCEKISRKPLTTCEGMPTSQLYLSFFSSPPHSVYKSQTNVIRIHFQKSFSFWQPALHSILQSTSGEHSCKYPHQHILSSSTAGVMPLGTNPDHYLHTNSYTLAARSCSFVSGNLSRAHACAWKIQQEENTWLQAQVESIGEALAGFPHPKIANWIWQVDLIFTGKSL